MRSSEETVDSWQLGSKARSDRWWLAQQRLRNSNTRASGLARRRETDGGGVEVDHSQPRFGCANRKTDRDEQGRARTVERRSRTIKDG